MFGMVIVSVLIVYYATQPDATSQKTHMERKKAYPV